MIRILLGLFALCFAAPIAAQTLTVTTPLVDRSGDGKVTLTKAMPPFKRGDVLIRCAPLVYAKVCPPMVRQMAPRGSLAAFSGRTYWQNVYPKPPIEGKVISGMSLTCGDTCIRFGRASQSGTVRDSEIRAASIATKCSEIDAGIAIGGSKGGVATDGVLIERVFSHGWRMNPALKCYLNGDGAVANRGVGTVTIRDSAFDDNADAGVDTKADLTVLDHVSATGNGHYGFRFWGRAEATTLYCTDNAWGCVEAEPGAVVTIDRLVAKGPQELVTTKKGAVVTVRSCDLTGWTGTAPTKGQGAVTLGDGCRR